MKAGWASTPLGEVARVTAGQSPRSSEYNADRNGLPFYQGKKDFTDRVIGEATVWTRAVTKEAFAGDILISVRAPVGPVNLARDHCCIGRGLAAIRPTKRVERDFLWYAMLWLQPTIVGNDGAVFNSINKKEIESLPIPIPPIEEQRRIVAILDEAFEGLARARANVEANVADAEELFARTRETRLAGETNWITARVADLAKIKHGYAFKSQWFSDAGEYKLLTPGNFYEEGGYREPARGQKHYNGEIPKEFVLRAGDLVMAMTEQAKGLLGSSFLVPEVGTFLHNQRIGLFEPGNAHDWDASFLCHVFNLASFREAVQLTASGVKVRHTSPKKIGEIRIRLPRDVEEQREIANELGAHEQSVSRLRSCYKDQLADLDRQRRATLASAFSGNLT